MAERKILLLSDGSRIFPVLSHFFQDEGYQVVTTDSSRGAIEAIRNGDFPLVITRLSRDRMEARVVLRSIRRMKRKPRAIVLRGEHEVNSPLEAYQVQGPQEVFIPCGWAGLRKLVASCMNG